MGGEVTAEVVSEALSLLARIPKAWAAVPDLSHFEEQAFGVLVAAGLVERRLSMRLRMAADRRAVAVHFRFTGQAGLARALDPAFTEAWALWGAAWNAGKKVYAEAPEGEGEWRLTDQGEAEAGEAAPGEVADLRDFLRTPGVPGAGAFPLAWRFVPGVRRPVVNGEGHADRVLTANAGSAAPRVQVKNPRERPRIISDITRVLEEGFQRLADARQPPAFDEGRPKADEQRRKRRQGAASAANDANSAIARATRDAEKASVAHGSSGHGAMQMDGERPGGADPGEGTSAGAAAQARPVKPRYEPIQLREDERRLLSKGVLTLTLWEAELLCEWWDQMYEHYVQHGVVYFDEKNDDIRQWIANGAQREPRMLSLDLLGEVDSQVQVLAEILGVDPNPMSAIVPCLGFEQTHEASEHVRAINTLNALYRRLRVFDEKAKFAGRSPDEVTIGAMTQQSLEQIATKHALRGTTRRGKTGRPVDTDPAADKRIADAWATGRFRTYAECARELGLSERKVRLAADRHRKRQRRASP
jgi:hypothetical protein